MSRSAAAQERTNRLMTSGVLSSSLFDERMASKIQQQRYYEKETLKLVKSSSQLLNELKDLQTRDEAPPAAAHHVPM